LKTKKIHSATDKRKFCGQTKVHRKNPLFFPKFAAEFLSFPMMKNLLLSPLSLLFGAAAKTRRRLYAKGFLKSNELDAKVISVGNITVGGTGKTPLVAYIAKILAQNGEKVCILTRGYGRENANERLLVSDGEKILANVKKSGDEPFELAEKLLGISAVLADKNRVSAGNWAIKNLGITAFILDDGFQHIQLKRDLDIVCIDAANPFGNGKLLPTGTLREPLESLNRADAIVITRMNLTENGKRKTENLIEEIKNFTAAPIFISRNRTNRKSKIEDQKCLAFCGLGNPENFFSQLRQDKINLVATKTFRDHYGYSQQDADEIVRIAKQNNAEILLTTAKDAVKLRDLKFELPLEIVESELIFDEPEKFKQLISEV
jgi:tetraacyldisaccharide 4'-kinase